MKLRATTTALVISSLALGACFCAANAEPGTPIIGVPIGLEGDPGALTATPAKGGKAGISLKGIHIPNIKGGGSPRPGGTDSGGRAGIIDGDHIGPGGKAGRMSANEASASGASKTIPAAQTDYNNNSSPHTVKPMTEANSALGQVSTTRRKAGGEADGALNGVSTTRRANVETGKPPAGPATLLINTSHSNIRHPGKAVETGNPPVGPAGAPVSTSRSNKKS